MSATVEPRVSGSGGESPKPRPGSRSPILLLLLALVLFQAGSNYFWLKADRYVPLHDENEYLAKSVNTLRLLAGPEKFTLKGFMDVEPQIRPHLFPLFALPVFLAAGVSYHSACLANSFFQAVLIVSTFAIAASLGNRRRGLLAAFIVAFYPFVLRFSRFFWSEIPLMAVFSAALYLLIKTDNFRSRKYSLALALAIAAGLLIQQRFVFFIATPLALYLVLIFLPGRLTLPADRGDRRRRSVNFLLSVLIPGLLTVPYYLYYREVYLTKFTYGIIGDAWKPVEGVFNPEAMFWYAGHLLKASSLFFFVLFLVGLAVLLFKFKRRYLLPLLACAGGYLLITAYPGKDARYVTPLLPLAAVITAEGIGRLRPKVIGRGLILLLIPVAFFNYLRVSWDVGPFSVPYHKTLFEMPFFTEPLELLPHEKKPRTLAEWRWEEIVERVREESGGGEAKLLVAPYLHEFNYLTFGYFCLMSGGEIESVAVGTKNLYHYNFNNLINADYIVTKTGAAVPEEHIRFEFARRTVEFLEDPPEAFRLSHREVARYPLPDGSEAILIARTAPVTELERMAVLEEVLLIEPDHPWALRELGEIYLKEEMPERALEVFRRIIPILPYWVGGYLSVGRAYVDLGRTEEAIEMIGRALEMAPGFDFAHYSLGTAYEQAGRFEEAREHYLAATRGSEERARKARERLEMLPDGRGRMTP